MEETQEMWVQSLGGEDPVEEEMSTHSNILAWKILWTEEPGGLLHGAAKNRRRLSDFTFFSFRAIAFTAQEYLLSL